MELHHPAILSLLFLFLVHLKQAQAHLLQVLVLEVLLVHLLYFQEEVNELEVQQATLKQRGLSYYLYLRLFQFQFLVLFLMFGLVFSDLLLK